MKALLISACASAVLALGWSAVSTTPAKANPQCVYQYNYKYCIYYPYYAGGEPPWCISDYNYQYCRYHPKPYYSKPYYSKPYHSGGGGGSSSY